MINSTYQSNDLSSGTEEDVLYQSDASFSAKLDNSYSHNNKQNLNKSVSNGDNSQSSSNVNNNINRNSKNSRYSKNVKNTINNSKVNKLESSKGVTKQTVIGSNGIGSLSNQNILFTDDDKRNVDFYNTIIDWNKNINKNQHPEADSQSDNDNSDYGYNNDIYNGDNIDINDAETG